MDFKLYILHIIWLLWEVQGNKYGKKQKQKQQQQQIFLTSGTFSLIMLIMSQMLWAK